MTQSAVTDIATRRKRPAKAKRETDAEWWARMARTYPHVDAPKQYDLASRWAREHGRACSRPYLLNWWKRAEEDARVQSPPPSVAAKVAAPHVNPTVAALVSLQEQGRVEREQRKVKA